MLRRWSIAASVLELVGLLVVGPVTFLPWFYRAYRNLLRRGISDLNDLYAAGGPVVLRYRSGWAIGAWFVPILNLFRPKQIMNDIWRGSFSHPGAGKTWRLTTVSGLVHWWWGLWIASFAVRLAARAARPSGQDLNTRNQTLDALEAERASFYIDMLAAALLIAAAALAIMIVRRVTKAQDRGEDVALAEPREETPVVGGR